MIINSSIAEHSNDCNKLNWFHVVDQILHFISLPLPLSLSFSISYTRNLLKFSNYQNISFFSFKTFIDKTVVIYFVGIPKSHQQIHSCCLIFSTMEYYSSIYVTHVTCWICVIVYLFLSILLEYLLKRDTKTVSVVVVVNIIYWR